MWCLTKRKRKKKKEKRSGDHHVDWKMKEKIHISLKNCIGITILVKTKKNKKKDKKRQKKTKKTKKNKKKKKYIYCVW